MVVLSNQTEPSMEQLLARFCGFCQNHSLPSAAPHFMKYRTGKHFFLSTVLIKLHKTGSV